MPETEILREASPDNLHRPCHVPPTFPADVGPAAARPHHVVVREINVEDEFPAQGTQGPGRMCLLVPRGERVDGADIDFYRAATHHRLAQPRRVLEGLEAQVDLLAGVGLDREGPLAVTEGGQGGGGTRAGSGAVGHPLVHPLEGVQAGVVDAQNLPRDHFAGGGLRRRRGRRRRGGDAATRLCAGRVVRDGVILFSSIGPRRRINGGEFGMDAIDATGRNGGGDLIDYGGILWHFY
mmetsp:Transcript_4871/g.10326  ORF Transcript_4871/g.10326 Transcript_4871/m.10326 type:complete len:237 (-) Transcript_4871:132-842(-)